MTQLLTGAPPRPGRAPASRVAADFVASQVGWFACVLAAAHGRPWVGVASAAVIVAMHVGRSLRPTVELALAALVMVVGAAWDSIAAASGLLTFASPGPIGALAPAWIWALWALFAITLNSTLGWLKGRWLLAAGLGSVCGPMAYWAGARMGAITMDDPWLTLPALGAAWAIILPLLLLLACRYDGSKVD